jgi:hypothetical protein
MAEITYRQDGYKYVDGHRVEPWASGTVKSSNGLTTYTVIYWRDGGFSCQCPGYAQRFHRVPDFRCKHIKAKAVELVQVATRPVELPARRRIHVESE